MKLSNPTQVWVRGGVAVAFGLFAIGWFFVISPQQSQTGDLRTQAASAQTQTSTLQHQLGQLQADNKNLLKYQAELTSAQSALPATAAIPSFLREMQAAGATTEVSVTAISVGAPTAVTAYVKPASTTTSTTTAAATGADAGAARGGYSVSLAVTATGTLGGINAFVAQLQQLQPRAVLVTSMQESPGTAGAVVLTLDLNAFLNPSVATVTK